MAKVIARCATKTNAAKPCNNGRKRTCRQCASRDDFSRCTRNSATSIEREMFLKKFVREKSDILTLPPVPVSLLKWENLGCAI